MTRGANQPAAAGVTAEAGGAMPDFRTTLGHFASGIVIIAACHQDRPVGLSLQSFASLSLDPPLVSLGASLPSATWPVIAEDRETLSETSGGSSDSEAN